MTASMLAFLVPLPTNVASYSIFCLRDRNLQDEFENYEASVKKLSEESKQQVTTPGNVVEALCEICHKTKFADGIGHQCHYCNLKSCARCGGKTILRTNKVTAVEVDAYCIPIYEQVMIFKQIC